MVQKFRPYTLLGGKRRINCLAAFLLLHAFSHRKFLKADSHAPFYLWL